MSDKADRPVWLNPPECPAGCGRSLNPAMGPWKDRGDWMCHGDHDGKRIWFDYELVEVLRARCERLEKQNVAQPTYAGLKAAIEVAPKTYLPALLVAVAEVAKAKRVFQPGAMARMVQRVEDGTPTPAVAGAVNLRAMTPDEAVLVAKGCCPRCIPPEGRPPLMRLLTQFGDLTSWQCPHCHDVWVG